VKILGVPIGLRILLLGYDVPCSNGEKSPHLFGFKGYGQKPYQIGPICDLPLGEHMYSVDGQSLSS